MNNRMRSDAALWFDETNYNDTGGGDTSLAPYGTLRKNAPLDERGYQPQDNHGADGGHFAFIDGHVEFREARVNNFENQPHDDIFDVVGDAVAPFGGTSAIETVDAPPGTGG